MDHGQRYDVLPLTVVTESMVRGGRRRPPPLPPEHRDRRREGLDETDWPGYGLRAGGVLIGVRNRRSRCVMTTFDPDSLEQDPRVLHRIVRSFGGQVALDCWVVEPGRVAEGDAVELVELPAASEPPHGNGGDPFSWRRAGGLRLSAPALPAATSSSRAS